MDSEPKRKLSPSPLSRRTVVGQGFITRRDRSIGKDTIVVEFRPDDSMSGVFVTIEFDLEEFARAITSCQASCTCEIRERTARDD